MQKVIGAVPILHAPCEEIAPDQEFITYMASTNPTARDLQGPLSLFGSTHLPPVSPGGECSSNTGSILAEKNGRKHGQNVSSTLIILLYLFCKVIGAGILAGRRGTYFFLKKRILRENKHILYVFEVIKAISAAVIWYVVPFRQDGTNRPSLILQEVSPGYVENSIRSEMLVIEFSTYPGLTSYSDSQTRSRSIFSAVPELLRGE